MTVEHSIHLKCHPSTRPSAVRAIGVLVRRPAGAELRMTFRLDGDIRRIRVPSPGAPRIAAQLWRHTCFEAFIAMEGQPAYHEFNFAPSGEWAVYAFSGYRNGGPLANEEMRPHIAVRSSRSWLELESLVRLDSLSAVHPRAPLRIGLSAVIEATMGSRTGRFAIRPTNRIFMTPMDSPCCSSRRPPSGRYPKARAKITP